MCQYNYHEVKLYVFKAGARPGFLELLLSANVFMHVCVYECVCVCVRPQGYE